MHGQALALPGQSPVWPGQAVTSLSMHLSRSIDAYQASTYANRLACYIVRAGSGECCVCWTKLFNNEQCGTETRWRHPSFRHLIMLSPIKATELIESKIGAVVSVALQSALTPLSSPALVIYHRAEGASKNTP